MSPEEARRVAALNLEGIGFVKESRRFYPNKELAAHLLGYVGIDNTGLGGIEFAYDTQIRGKDGDVLVHTDARRHVFSRFERPPTVGLDGRADHRPVPAARRRARAARRASRENRAAGGTAIIMNPRTGEILAMANEPTFNPNAYRDVARDRAPQPRRAGSLRARLDVQDRHRVGGDRRAGDADRHDDRHEPGLHPHRLGDASHDTSQPRRAVVHRRDRQVEQRRRDQDRLQGRHRAARASTCSGSASAGRVARLPRREPRHRLGSGEVDRERAGVRCRWAIRWP